MPGIRRRSHLHIWKTERPVVVGLAIETAPLLLICGKHLLEVRAAELAS